jgi:hypothetical protein
MIRRQSELAQKKQRLLLRSAEQRRQLVSHATALRPVFDGAENIRNGLYWMRTHPVAMIGVLVAVMVARPRTLIRWARRGWVVWLAWRNWEAGNDQGRAPDNSLINLYSAFFSR